MQRLMVRVLVIVLVHSAWWAGSGAFAAAVIDREHAALHLEGVGHHHHDDSVHLDDSIESTLHLAADSAGGTAALHETSLKLPQAPRYPPSADAHRPLAGALVEGPLRPPKPLI